MLSRGKNQLMYQAKSEAQLLLTYNVVVPSNDDIMFSTSEIDTESVKTLNMFHPIMNIEYFPLRTQGDGNCLYRAISLALSGSEEHHVLLRLLVSLELIINRSSYDTKKKNNDFLKDSRIVTSDYNKLVTDAVTINSFSEMAHIYAVSASLGKPIESYFPPQLQAELSYAFTRVVCGRQVKVASTSNIVIMWTVMLAPDTPRNFNANHFVPLVKQNSCVNVSEVDLTSIDISNSVENIHVHVEPSSDETDLEQLVDSTSEISHDSVIVENDKFDPIKESSICSESLPSVEITHEPMIVEDDKFESMKESTICSESDPSATDDTPDALNIFGGSLDSGFLDTGTVVMLLLKNKSGLPKIPGGLKENVYFVLDNSSNCDKRTKNKRSAFSDDCGVWDASSGASPKSYYLMHDNGDLSMMFLRKGIFCIKKQVQRKVEYIPLNPQPEMDKVVVIHRYYTTLKVDKLYKKRVTWLGEGGLQSSLAVAEYVGKFPGLAPHGNARQPTEYLRTPDIVMKEISDMTDKHKPHQIYNKLKQKYDEVTRPTGLQQIYDKQKYEKSKERQQSGHTNNIADQIKHIENMVSEGDNFVRSIIRNNKKPPCIILYTDEQITDLKNLCCSGQTVLGIDKTFMLCKMHVTVTCYKQMTVNRHRTDEPPLFIGPLFIHDNSDFETYSYFFHHLKLKLMDTNLSKLVIGSDDEKALVKAITTVLPEATHVLCTRHLTENARQKLTDDAVSVIDRNTILKKIFGSEGIADANDTICFEAKCDDFESYCSEISETFVKYFHDRLKGHLKFKVNEPTRNDMIERKWTNNNCESVNHVLKQTVDWKTRPLTDFIERVRELIEGQFKELRSALLGTGEFRLADSHTQFLTTKTDWICMTDEQQTNLFKRYRKFVAKDDRYVVSTDGQSTVVAPRTNGRKPGQRKRKINVRTVSIKSKKV